jgi:hypothetical protein
MYPTKKKKSIFYGDFTKNWSYEDPSKYNPARSAVRWGDHDKHKMREKWIMVVKLPGRGKFNHLTITLILTLTCGLKLPFNRWDPTREIFNLNGG